MCRARFKPRSEVCLTSEVRHSCRDDDDTEQKSEDVESVHVVLLNVREDKTVVFFSLSWGFYEKSVLSVFKVNWTRWTDFIYCPGSLWWFPPIRFSLSVRGLFGLLNHQTATEPMLQTVSCSFQHIQPVRSAQRAQRHSGSDELLWRITDLNRGWRGRCVYQEDYSSQTARVGLVISSL